MAGALGVVSAQSLGLGWLFRSRNRNSRKAHWKSAVPVSFFPVYLTLVIQTMHLCLLEEFNDMAVVNMLLDQKKVNSMTKEHAWTAEAATDIDAMMTRNT